MADERETVITWYASEKIAHVHAGHKRVWRKLERYGYKATKEYRSTASYDDEGNAVESGRVYAKDFDIPLACVSLRRGKRLGSDQADDLVKHPDQAPRQNDAVGTPKRRTLSPEHIAAMVEGRRRARLANKEATHIRVYDTTGRKEV